MKEVFLLKKVSALLVLCLCCTFISPVQAFAQTNDENTNVSDTKSYKNVSITYVDPELVGTTKNSTAKSSIPNSINSTTATYLYSTYQFVSASLTQAHSMPLTDQKRLATVPEGYKVTLGSDITVSGTIKYDTGVGATIKEVINLGFGLTVSGTLSYTYSKYQEFSFPPSYHGIYNTAIYYGASDFDKYTVCVGVTNHYSDGSTDYYESYTSGVNRPVNTLYTVGVNY